MKVKCASLLVLSAIVYAFAIVIAQENLNYDCPPLEDIEPCTCEIAENSGPVLQCDFIDSVEILRTISSKITGNFFDTVKILNCSLPYIPHEMFEGTVIDNMHIMESTITDLFDTPPESLKGLELFDLLIQKKDFWHNLKPITNLERLAIYYEPIKVLDDKFSDNVSPELTELTIFHTDTKTIKPGALAAFGKLNYVGIEDCGLKKLTRDIFPSVFHVKTLNFKSNKFESIPKDMFTNMPDLWNVDLSYNPIKTLLVTVFDKGVRPRLYLTGTKLICDCKLKWMLQEYSGTEYLIGGTCIKNLVGQELVHAEFDKINCRSRNG